MQRSAIKEITGNLLLMAILLLLAPGIGRAASGCDGAGNCYVRAGATGSGNGADWTNAYTSIPATLTRGVTYYVAAGSYGPHAFSDADSGTTLITVQAATIASHGTSTGWSNAYQGQATFSCSSDCGSIIRFNADYYVFNGVYRSTATGNPETDWVLESGYGFKVSNTNAKQCGGHAGAGDIQAGQGYSGDTPQYVHDVTVQYVDVAGANPTDDSGCLGFAIDWEGGSYNLTFDHGYIHNEFIPFFIKGNHNHQNAQGFVFGSGNGNTIQYTYVFHDYSSPTYHGEACSCSEGLTNFTWRYNYTDEIGGTGLNGSTSHIATPSGATYNTGNGPDGPWFIYGNVFTTTADTNCLTGDGVLAIFGSTFTDNVYFLNNTTYNLGKNYCNLGNGNPESGVGLGLAITTPMQAFYSENNLFFNADPMTIIPTGTTSWNGATLTGTTWSYNSYFQTPTAGGRDSDPQKQVSASNPFANAGACCVLALDTSAGTNTHALVPGNDVDMNGVSRGANGTWDRGALQISSAPPKTPTNLTATPH